MKIKSIEVVPFVIPLIKPLVWAAGKMDVVDWLLVKIEGEDGVYGVSEAIPRPMIYGETQESIYYAITKYIAPLIIGEDSFAIEIIWEKMGAVAFNPGAKAAIDMALWDLNGKITGLPIYKMLGGPYRKKVDLCWMIGMKPAEEMIDEAVKMAEEGFRAFKVKGGIEPESDIKILKEMKKKVPENVKFYIDANQRYDKETAYRVLTELEGVLDCIEEPMAVFDDEGRKELSMKTNVPILGDDSVFTVADVSRQIKLGALKRIGLKFPRTGFTLSSRIVHLAEAANMKMQILTQSETTIGTVACLHLAAAFKQISEANEMTAYLEVTDSLIKEELIIKDGAMLIPEGPGLGIEIDWDKLSKYRRVIV